MNPQDKKLVMVGLIICVIIAVLAPFIASSSPDGLEKSAELVGASDEPTGYQAPFADYLIPVFGDGPFSGVIALVTGVLIVLGLGYCVSALFKRRSPPNQD